MIESTERDLELLRAAIDLAHRCPPSPTAFSVGAVLVDAEAAVLARGYSRQHAPDEHAEEAALAVFEAAYGADRPELSGATLYSSLEPCSARSSRPKSCTRHILEAGIGRVVFAWREPPVFVDGRGTELLRSAGCTVLEVPELAEAAMAMNSHISGISPRVS
ncbi:deaminase [Sciscionella marina]|uniref:deaminase n=1 Tax=Sciscionella marina TaxID=508770 RepID=UPI000380A99B|nr:deaminase [Sciscionella marina]